jgi:cytochrome oxidase Cu insertion factor (SCO1/SenC/PrrC family)
MEIGRDPAPEFRLANQFGQPVVLAEQRGTVVVLTFLYTHCPNT